VKANLDQGICYLQPKTLAQRIAIAKDFSRRFHYPLPLAVDDMADAAERAYAAWPERLYVIGEGGKILYKGGPGPADYRPEELRAWLDARFRAPRGASAAAE
jgi:hypothetical protein